MGNILREIFPTSFPSVAPVELMLRESLVNSKAIYKCELLLLLLLLIFALISLETLSVLWAQISHEFYGHCESEEEMRRRERCSPHDIHSSPLLPGDPLVRVIQFADLSTIAFWVG